MFTGLIKDVGVVVSTTSNLEGIEFVIRTNLISEINVDDSVAVNGVCLTATEIFNDAFKAQAVHLTLEKTNLTQLKESSLVNLELAMRASDRLGGHMVQGHVGGVAEVIEVNNIGENYQVWFKLPSYLSKFVFKEGSIAINGISLTVADKKDNDIMITVIPHTWKHTQIHQCGIGAKVNIEVDQMAQMISHYVEMILNERKNA